VASSNSSHGGDGIGMSQEAVKKFCQEYVYFYEFIVFVTSIF